MLFDQIIRIYIERVVSMQTPTKSDTNSKDWFSLGTAKIIPLDDIDPITALLLTGF